MEKPSPDFSDEGLNFSNSHCYFLQQQQEPQHSLPLESVSFVGGVCAVAVPITAARLRINKRYFIKISVLILILNFGHAMKSRAEPSL
jgi:hypothetical protein